MTPRAGVRPGDFGLRGTFRDRLGKSHQFHSLYERRRMALFDAAGYRFQREPVRIPYRFGGRKRIYRPDFAIWDRQGRPYYIEEVKPFVRLGDPVNQAKFAAARAWCNARGWRFRVVTEAGLDRL